MEAVVRTALSEVGKTYPYNLLKFNCENFAIFCKSGGATYFSKYAQIAGGASRGRDASDRGNGGRAEHAVRRMAGFPFRRPGGQAPFACDPPAGRGRDPLAGQRGLPRRARAGNAEADAC